MESIIAENALDMKQRVYGLSLNEIRRKVFEIAERHGLSHPFGKTKKMAGRHWLNGFLDRNNTLSVRPEPTSICRAVGFNKPQVDKFFEIWMALLEDLGEIDGSRLWNMDESGLTAVLTWPNYRKEGSEAGREDNERRTRKDGHHTMQHERTWATYPSIHDLPQKEDASR